LFGKDVIWSGGAVDARPNTVKKGFEIKILPDICALGENIWQKTTGEISFLTEVWYYRTVNMKERNKIDIIWEIPLKRKVADSIATSFCFYDFAVPRKRTSRH
jgi:hypothetical protein